MSHFFTIVLLPETAIRLDDPADIYDRVSAILAPYNENREVEPYTNEYEFESTRNPQGQWDWWDFGGRYNGEIRNAYRGDESGFNFPDEFRTLGENIIHAKQVDHRVSCSAIITPDGQWNDSGWDESEEAERVWEEKLFSILRDYRNCFLIGIDCHS